MANPVYFGPDQVYYPARYDAVSGEVIPGVVTAPPAPPPTLPPGVTMPTVDTGTTAGLTVPTTPPVTYPPGTQFFENPKPPEKKTGCSSCLKYEDMTPTQKALQIASLPVRMVIGWTGPAFGDPPGVNDEVENIENNPHGAEFEGVRAGIGEGMYGGEVP